MEKNVNKVILIEGLNRREVSLSEIESLRSTAIESKNGTSIVLMKEDSEREGCQVYRKLHTLKG